MGQTVNRLGRPLAVITSLLMTWSLPESFLAGQERRDPAVASRPARSSPDWLRSGVIYEVNVRTFSSEGTLAGVIRQLDRLRTLGVNILWLMPIHPNGQVEKKGTFGSPYAVRDYYAIDPQLGTKSDLKTLVTEAHRRGIKLIMDIVANHTAWDSVLMSHPDFYVRNGAGRPVSPYNWSDVVKLDYANPAVRRYMTDMLLYWVKQFDVDGYRCDVAFEVPTDFWEEGRRELESIKSDIMMLAEASKPDLLRSAFDIDYAWPLMCTVNAVFMTGEPAASIRTVIEQQKTLFPHGALHMRVSDDHDEERAIARYGEPGALAGSVLMFTLDGVPLLYNGMELGDSTESGGPALFEPAKVLWQMADRRPKFAQLYTHLIPLRLSHPALVGGELVWIENSAPHHVLS